MKKYLLLILGLVIFTYAFAQEEDAGKALRKASHNVATYNLDPAANADKLTEAVSLIDMVVDDSEYKRSSKAWYTYGQVYSELVNQDARALVLNPDHEIEYPEAGAKVYAAFKKAYDYAEKNYEKKDALAGLQGILNNISYLANTILRSGNYEVAYDAYMAVIEGSDFLTKKGEENPLGSKESIQDQVYLAALSAISAEKVDEAGELFQRLYDEEYDNAAVFEGLYNVRSAKGDTAGAKAALVEGREKYPEDKGLLFTWINDALSSGLLENVIDELKIAHRAEPENSSVPATLGNVYSQLSQDGKCDAQVLMAGDDGACYYTTEEGEQITVESDICGTNVCFAKSLYWYNKALEIKSDDFVSLYGLGELRYNLAATYANEANELADDYTPAGTKKWEAKKTQMMEQFEKALPYFLKAYEVNDSDLNTLVALREIYVRKDQIEKSNEYKARIDELQGGGQ